MTVHSGSIYSVVQFSFLNEKLNIISCNMSKTNKQILQTGKYEYEVNIYIKKTCANKSRRCFENVPRCTNVNDESVQIKKRKCRILHKHLFTQTRRRRRKKLKRFEDELEKGKEDVE